MNVKAILMAAMVLAASLVSAQASLTDLMDATGLKYKITKSGNAMTTYTLDGGRTQAVYISKRQYQVGNLNLREIWSNAGTVSSDAEAETLRKLLTDGGEENVGAWMVEENDDGWLVYYSAKLPDLSAADLKSVMRYIAAVADAKEQELGGNDEDSN
jgi:hypothetical protein